MIIDRNKIHNQKRKKNKQIKIISGVFIDVR